MTVIVLFVLAHLLKTIIQLPFPRFVSISTENKKHNYREDTTVRVVKSLGIYSKSLESM